MDAVNRTIVGFRVPPHVSESMQQGVLLLKRKPGVENVRWSAPSEYVVALAHLGELSPATIGRLRETLAPAIGRFPCLRFQIRGFSGVPNQIQPRFVTATLEGDTAALEEMARSIDLAVSSLTPAREFRKFDPNVAIGRLKTESETFRVNLGRALKMPLTPEMGSLEIDHLELLTSRADTTGIGYTCWAEFPLGVLV